MSVPEPPSGEDNFSRRSFVLATASAVALGVAADPAHGGAPRRGDLRQMFEGQRSGTFRWSDRDQSRGVAADPLQALYLPPPSDATGRSGAWVRRTRGEVRPEWFGAEGDGVTNDSAAMAALARFVTAAGGGEVVFRKTVYIVGAQARGSGDNGYAFPPSLLLEFRDCTRPLRIEGNGACLRCAPGLRYGTFDPETGAATHHPLPFLGGKELATPYGYMLHVSFCTGRVEIRNLELDGSLGSLLIGGPYGDTGYQVPAVGIELRDNQGDEILTNLHLHHHAQDGLSINGVGAQTPRKGRSVITDVRCEYNGRQGCSLVGGLGYRFVRSRFSHTGRVAIGSAPGAGVDLEAEADKLIRDVSFVSCTFADNIGCGLVADNGDTAKISFDDCLFVGTTNWSVWPNKPDMLFSRCRFAGAIVKCYGDDGTHATRFVECTFVDDPALSPTGKLYFGDNPTWPAGDLPFSYNVRFVRSRFQLTHDAVLPWTDGVIFEDCTMTQRAPAASHPRGRYVGTNLITGNADLGGSTIDGRLTVNGIVRN